VGSRLARLAANKVYGKQIPCLSPMFERISKEGRCLRISFRHAEGGLTTKEGAPVRGFVIAGSDRRFVWAEATIEGAQVIVSSPEIQEPVAVRYAWANHPISSLFNKDGLPLAPFRTDDWNP
jgi:sialate O-acetylesterase